MIEYYKTLYAYDHWANLRILQAWRNSPSSSVTPQAQKWFSHVLLGHYIWHLRLTGQLYEGMSFWEVLSFEECEKYTEKIAENWRIFLSGMTDERLLHEMCHHKNTEGLWFDLPIADILTYVANHATYHRGQIIADLRAHGGEPLATDFVVYRRIITGQMK